MQKQEMGRLKDEQDILQPDGLQVEQDQLKEEQEYSRTGRAERQLAEQNRLYGKHVRRKKEQEKLQDDQARLLCM
jgi:uncharacterized Zn finger protein